MQTTLLFGVAMLSFNIIILAVYNNYTIFKFLYHAKVMTQTIYWLNIHENVSFVNYCKQEVPIKEHYFG